MAMMQILSRERGVVRIANMSGSTQGRRTTMFVFSHMVNVNDYMIM